MNPDGHANGDHRADPDAPAGGDALTELRDGVDRIDELPVADRVARFEHVNEVIASELARLDEI